MSIPSSHHQKQDSLYQYYLQLVDARSIAGVTKHSSQRKVSQAYSCQDAVPAQAISIDHAKSLTLAEAAQAFFNSEYLSKYLTLDKQYLTLEEDRKIQSALFDQFKITDLNELESRCQQFRYSIPLLAGYCLRCRASEYQLFFCHTAAEKYSNSSQERQELFLWLAATLLTDNQRLALCLMESGYSSQRSLISWKKRGAPDSLEVAPSLTVHALKTWKMSSEDDKNRRHKNLKNWIFLLGYRDPQVKSILPTKEGIWSTLKKTDINHFPYINSLDKQLFEELQAFYEDFRETLSPEKRKQKCEAPPDEVLEAALEKFRAICKDNCPIESIQALVDWLTKIARTIQSHTIDEPVEAETLQAMINQEQVNQIYSWQQSEESLSEDYQAIIQAGLIAHLDRSLAEAIEQRLTTLKQSSTKRRWVLDFQKILIYTYCDELTVEEISQKTELSKYQIRSRFEELNLIASVRDKIIEYSILETQQLIGKPDDFPHLLPEEFDSLCQKVEKVIDQAVFHEGWKEWGEEIVREAKKEVHNPRKGRTSVYAQRMRAYLKKESVSMRYSRS